MKKIISQVAISLLCVAPVLAEDYPIDLMVRDMGYTSRYMTVDVVNSVKKSNADAKAYYATKKLEEPKKRKESSCSSPQRGFTKEEILQPRISEASESPEMIPALLRYHKANPKADKITRKLAVTTYSLGQYKEALYWYTLTYQRNRNDLESLWNMATIADSIGEKSQARVYLKEYARVDPNSAWGRMAKNLLNSGYSSDNMTESFDDEMARFLDSSSGVSNSNKQQVKNSDSTGDDGMIVVSGDKYDLESFVASYKSNKNFSEKKTKDGDTLKGNNSQLKLDSKNKEGLKTSPEKVTNSENKTSIAKPIIEAKVVTTSKKASSNVAEEEKNVKAVKAVASVDEDAGVKSTAAPLGD